MASETAPISVELHDTEIIKLPEKTLPGYGRQSLVDLAPDILYHIAKYVARSAAPGRQREAMMSLMLVHPAMLSAGIRCSWEALEFPEMDFFRRTPFWLPNEAMLLKYGQFVRSISMKFQARCARCSSYGHQLPKKVRDHSIQRLATESNVIAQVLQHCTGLRELSLRTTCPICRWTYNGPESHGESILVAFLCSMTPHLKNLRRLTVHSLFETSVSKMIVDLPLLESLTCIGIPAPQSTTAPDLAVAAPGTLLGPHLSQLIHLKKLTFHDVTDKFVTQIISHCPLTETLSYNGFGKPYRATQQGFHPQPFLLLGPQISGLKHLTRLKMDCYNLLNKSWLEYDWPRTITNIDISWCPYLSLQDAPGFLSRAAPNLTRLKLYGEPQATTDGSVVDLMPFDLPRLTHLCICAVGGNTDLVSWFKGSKNIQDLQYYEVKESDLQSLSILLSASTWPNLHRITLSYWDALESDNQYKMSISEYCDRHRILLFQKH